MKIIFLTFISTLLISCNVQKNNIFIDATKQYSISGRSSDLNNWVFELNVTTNQKIQIESIETEPFKTNNIFNHIKFENGLTSKLESNLIIQKGKFTLIGTLKSEELKNKSIEKIIFKYKIKNKIFEQIIIVKKIEAKIEK